MAESARMELVECEREIQKIKGALRQVGSEDGQNSLQVIWVEKDDADQNQEISLQLSSPVEEAVLNNGGETTFAGVESSMATLTVTLRNKNGGDVLGTSEACDLAPILSLGDTLEPKEEYVIELPVAIVGTATDDSAEDTAVAAEATAETTEEDKPDEKEGEKTTTDEEPKKEEEEKETTEETKKEEEKETPKLIKPLATINLRLVFKPSAKDRKEELYELLNKASVRRSQALERHRGQQQETITKKSASSPGKKPAVKAGFLNKKTKKAPVEESKWQQFYDKYMGPTSMARGLIIPIAKNYVIFFGAVVLAHYKGQELALPAPV
ncbi:expressed unknown protein [Seminavis robusta]|uniref:Uncharacterized protein n=1 Tax=Seminavis robusta TaxID=568900 RepID=A0A9N8DGE1_9STRA|nr:expressed unknown protein [Seminavis robusta]|eukprot:Sro79_g042830.1 n/a (325) ;mRNA; f:93369-94343